MADLLLTIKELTDRYTFFFPEKFIREIGVNYQDDLEERQRYTIDNLIDKYYNVITEYLSENNFESIIIGSSEGAFILPVLYERLNSPKITALISDSGGGGLTRYEQYQIRYEKLLANDKSYASLTEDERERELQYFEKRMLIFKEEPYPESIDFIDDHPKAMTYRWVSSMMRLRLFDYYKNIGIPILFIHGELDTDVPVETIRFIENNLLDKPFDYIYYPEGIHGITTRRQYSDRQRDISQWILKVDQ